MSTEPTGRLAVLTSGGDAPGMNAAIRAATTVAIARGWQVYGVMHGYRGLVDGDIEPLTADDVAGIIREGGTVLGSARCPEFHELAARDAARAHLAERGVGALLVVGGNGSLTGAHALVHPSENDSGLRTVGVPASIDNDMGLTSLSVGVDTAMNTIVEACDKISDTASAHDRTFIVEVMGRDCGYLAMSAAIASGADVALFRESDKSEDAIVEQITRAVVRARKRESRRTKRVLVIKAEGVRFDGDRLNARVQARLEQEMPDTKTKLETRTTVLGHVVRGGRPSAFDRLLASRLGHTAVRALIDGDNDKMAAWMLGGQVPPGIATRSPFDPHCWLVDLKAALVETQHLLDGSSEHVKWRVKVFDELEDVLTL